MMTMNLKLYNLFKTKLNLSDADAQEVVQELENTIKEQNVGKHEHTVEIINKDIQSLKISMDAKFDSMKEYMDVKFATKEDIVRLDLKVEKTKSDLTKSIYMVGLVQFLAIVASVVSIMSFIFLHK